jgi:6-phosphogluconolactonase (cycloisomerase 2 family)
MLPASLTAQSFVYVNNQDTTNTISGFSVAASGALTPISGSPFVTGGAGSSVTCFGLDRMVVSTVDNLLFVSNSGDQTISVFQINPTTGALTIAPGSPVVSGLAADGCGGMSLAATPDGHFLMASSNGSIQSFNIAASGALTPAVLSTPTAPSTSVGMKISSDGKYLALSNETSVSMFTIDPNTSALTSVATSPFARQSTGLISGLEFSCAVDTLYASESSFGSSAITDAWSIGAATSAAPGALTPVAGSPLLTPGLNDSNAIALSPDGNRLFTTDQLNGKIASFSVAAGGSLASSSILNGVGSVHVPTGLTVDAAGAFLYVADDTFGIAVFSIATDGSLTPVSDVATIPGQEMQGVATYPTRSCVSGDVSLDSLTVTPSSTVDSGSQVTFSIAVTNPATATGPAAETVTYTLPAGLSLVSCAATGTGVCNQGSPTVSFSAIPAGTTETVTIVAATSTDLANGASLTTTATITSKSVVDANTANDTVSATITISAVAGPTTLTVAPATAPFGGTAALTATLTKNANSAGVIGKTITFTLNGVAVGSAVTNSAGTATLNVSIAGQALGTLPITANFAGDALFTTSSGSGTLTINSAVLTVVSNFSMVYGDPVPSPLPYTITGFVNGNTIGVVTGTAACSSAVTSTSHVGSYPTTCDITALSAPNYTFVTLPGAVTVTPAPISVTVDNATRLYGDPNPVFTGTPTGARNGDVLNPIYLTSAQVTSGVGNYAIVPTISGDYTITSAVNGILTITPAPLSVVANNASRVFGAPNPPFTGTIVGLKNADAITPAYSTTATAASPVGAYPINVQLLDPNFKLSNYTVSITNGTLTISQATLVVTAANASRIYGAANPVFTGTITGLNPGDNITATYASAATAASPVGIYPIVPTLVDPGGKLVNYTVSVVNGTLTVSTAPLTVTINNASRVYGSANPTLKGTISGLVNGDSITATYSSVGVTAPVGTYRISPTYTDPGAKITNYTITIVGGVLTVTPAPLTVTAVGGTRLYGGVNPAATISGLKNGDNITTTYTTPTSASPVGTYTLTPVLVDPGLLVGNYTVTTKTATLTITKAPLTITANNATVVLNTATPGFTATFTGLVLGQDPSVLTGTLNCTAAVNTVGTHPITCSGVTSTNYSLTFVGGTATVDYAALGVCAAGPGHQILAPINADGSSVFTASTTTSIPVQFRVCDANGVAVSTGTVVTNFRLLQKITGGVATNLNQSQGTAFTFNAAAQDWLFNLSTSNPTNLAAGSTYVYQITLADGTTINFQFSMI